MTDFPPNPAPGASEDTWGDQLNTILDSVKTAVGSLENSQVETAGAIAEIRALAESGTGGNGGGGNGGGLDADAVHAAIVDNVRVTAPLAVASDATSLTLSTSATVNSTDAQLRSRSTHTGTQVASSISDFSQAAQGVFATLGPLRVLRYANGSYPTRPVDLPAGCVKYIGPVQPSDWLPDDEWMVNA